MRRKAQTRRRTTPKKPQATPGIGEETMFVMVQAGVDRGGTTRSRARFGLLVALFALAGVGIVIGALTLVQMVEWKIPSTPGRDELRAEAEAARRRAAERNRASTVLAEEQIRASRPRTSPKVAGSDVEVLDLMNAKEDAKPLPVPVVDPAATPLTLTDEQVKRTIQRSQSAFESCIDASLRRRGFREGRVLMSVTVMPSGAVSRATMDEPSIERSDLGACLRSVCKRMVFPAFRGPAFELQLPLLLSSGQ